LYPPAQNNKKNGESDEQDRMARRQGHAHRFTQVTLFAPHWLRIRTGSLLPGMILHAAWNAANILLELYQ